MLEPPTPALVVSLAPSSRGHSRLGVVSALSVDTRARAQRPACRGTVRAGRCGAEMFCCCSGCCGGGGRTHQHRLRGPRGRVGVSRWPGPRMLRRAPSRDPRAHARTPLMDGRMEG
eukprot:scaffold2385_cov272-Prasinococcus_capsulatus_cf.AAC.2